LAFSSANNLETHIFFFWSECRDQDTNASGGSAKMKNKTFTLMVVSGKQETVQRFLIHRRGVLSLGVGLILFVFLICGLVVHYAILSPGLFEASQYKSENEELNQNLVLLKKKMKALEKKLTSLHSLDQKLRKRTDLHGQGRKLAMGPLSGPVDTNSFPRHHLEGFAFPVDSPAGSTLHDGLLEDHIDSLVRQSDHRLDSLRQLREYYRERNSLLASIPSIWPSSGYFTSGFGYRRDPFTGGQIMHQGVDIAGPEGTPVISPASGSVIYVGDGGGYGQMIALDHGNGLITRYGHLSRTLIKMGQRVKRGDHIGATGNTGRSTGPHLHYEVRIHGVAVDPKRYVLNW
jgi:murein DD-endopeptidase MepM/ murein hydrolase activator NlpD